MLGKLWNLLPVETLHGYEHPELVETIFLKTVAYEPTEPWPEMEGVSSVLDFGGACGRHYKEAKQHSPAIHWAVVETPAMAARARELETRQLKFFTEISAAAEWLGSIEVVHSNGAVQYAHDPLTVVRQLCTLDAKQMLWRRVLLGYGGSQLQVSRLADNGPGQMRAKLKRVSYEQRPLDEAEFLAAHHGYRIKARGEDWFNFVR